MLSTRDKIFSYEDVDKINSHIKGKKTVVVGGCFDIVHYGHYVFLTKAREYGDILTVLLESDEFINQRKKRTPVHNQQERSEIISSFSFVDFVIKLPFFKDDGQYYEIIKKLAPSVIAITEGDPQFINKKKQADMVGGELRIVSDHVKKFSTSNIIKNETISSS